MGIVYKVTCRVNGKGYIGHTTQTLVNRMSVHKRQYSGCRALKAAIAKHGWDNFDVEVLEEGLVDDTLRREREKELIAAHGTFGAGGYNLTPGGEITPMIFPEVVARRKATINTPEGQAKAKARYASPEVGAAISKGTKEAWARLTPAERADRIERNRIGAQTEEVKARRTAALKANASFADGQFVAQNRPETVAKRRATWEAKQEAAWALLSPEEAQKKRAKAAKAREKRQAKKAVDFEVRMASITASSATKETEVVSDSDEESYAWWLVGMERTEISPI